MSCLTIAILSLVGFANFFLMPDSKRSSLSLSSGDKVLANLSVLNSLSIFFNSASDGALSSVESSSSSSFSAFLGSSFLGAGFSFLGSAFFSAFLGSTFGLSSAFSFGAFSPFPASR
jgi:hypothetical protein